MNSNMAENVWLCRCCNSLIEESLSVCPQCGAERPESAEVEGADDGVEEVVSMDGYRNVGEQPKAKYNFREGVLVNAADIMLVLGLFVTFGALIAPIIVDFAVVAPMMWATVIAVVVFAFTMVQWALLRTVADISRRTREMHERK